VLLSRHTGPPGLLHPGDERANGSSLLSLISNWPRQGGETRCKERTFLIEEDHFDNQQHCILEPWNSNSISGNSVSAAMGTLIHLRAHSLGFLAARVLSS
jgi:hypothetical protein